MRIHITISLAGLAPQIRKLAGEPTQFRLAISLHGATDEVRSRIMPVNRRYNLATLLAACDDYVAQKKRLMFEYILIAGVNDADEQAHQKARESMRSASKAGISLIPYGTVEGTGMMIAAVAESSGKLPSVLLARRRSRNLAPAKSHDTLAACRRCVCRQESGA